MRQKDQRKKGICFQAGVMDGEDTRFRALAPMVGRNVVDTVVGT
jgi:hypothetical protein